MSTRGETAKGIFEAGYNCAQSVFLAFSDDYGIERDTAARICNCLGGGMAHTGNMCGALSAAMLSISGKYGKKDPSEAAQQEQTFQYVQELVDRFQKEFGAIDCPDLLESIKPENHDQLSEEEQVRIRRAGCARFVQQSADIAGEFVDQ